MCTGFIPTFTSAITNKKEYNDDNGNDNDDRKEAAIVLEVAIAIALVLTEIQKEQ